jgi:hypothetical protein
MFTFITLPIWVRWGMRSCSPDFCDQLVHEECGASPVAARSCSLSLPDSITKMRGGVVGGLLQLYGVLSSAFWMLISLYSFLKTASA